MKNKCVRQLPSLLAAASAISTVQLADAATSAVEATRSFSGPGGDLQVALQAFARQTDREVLFDSGLVSGKSTRGFSGK